MNPNSKLWLCQTNLENDYKNTLSFSTKAEQRNYFIGNPSDPTSFGVSTKSYSDYTYLRLEQSIKVDDFIENIDTNNYLVLLNNNKYYYYFITSMSYVDDETTKIHIELDVMQTYFFDINYKETFVEREHVTDDTPGKHTIPEGLETGEYVTILGSETLPDRQDLIDLTEEFYPVFAVTHRPGSLPNNPAQGVFPQYNGIWSGLWYVCVKPTDVDIARFIQDCENTTDCEITSIFMCPKGLVNPVPSWNTTTTGFIYNYFEVIGNDEAEDLGSIIVNKENHLDNNYVPRNKKLLCFPYNYFIINNYAGKIATYKYEEFTTANCGFKIKGSIGIGCDIRLTPEHYRKGNKQSEISMYKLPTCPWVSDSYTNWLTQNSVNDTISRVQNVGTFALGTGLTMFAPGMGKFVGMTMMASSLGMTFDKVKSKLDHELVPDEAKGGINNGDINLGEFRNFNIEKYCIKEEYAKIIDKFFDQFGYQVNILKTPSIHTRRYWNYLKTQNCNFTGNIPQEYMIKIKTIFDNGITFWHDPSKMFDYSQTNSVLS